MEKKQKKQVKKYISWVLIVVIVVLLACLPMIAANDPAESGPQASILSATAENRSVSQIVLGGGALAAEDAVSVTIPATVKVTEYLVANGDVVAEGQPVASVDRVSVMSTITEVQETMEDLRKELNTVSKKTESTKVTATAGGTVKVIYGAVGENVQDVMLRDGALCVISLDGLMAVQVDRSTGLSGGDTVCVAFSDGTEVTGKVESNLEGILTVTVEDDGYAVGETVKVTTEDGDRIGSGILYIHNPWNALAYSGTISRIRVKEGETVTAGRRLFDLEDTGHTAQFDLLSRQHQEYEALMLELFEMYQSETVNAPRDGMITGVDEDGTYMLSDSGSYQITLLANAPGEDPDASFANFVGQVAEVGTDGLIMNMNPTPFAMTDYMDLSGVLMDTSRMTVNTIYSAGAPIYALVSVTQQITAEDGTVTESTEKQWQQIASVSAGDILLFALSDTGVAWVVRVGSAQLPAPGQGGGNTSQGSNASQGGMPSGGMGSMPGGGMGGSVPDSSAQEGTEEVSLLDTVTIASVTDQERVTLQISVDELDISGIYVGQAVDITVDALTGQKFDGTVSKIAGDGTNEGGNSKFTVDITIDKIPDMLPGMTAHAAIKLSTTENIVCIPVEALIETGTRTMVYTGYDEENEAFTNPATVTTGISDGTYVQILSGLDAQQTVFYPYYDTLVISNAPEAGGFSFGR